MALGTLLVVAIPTAAELPQVPFLDLGTLPDDTDSVARDINAAGQVVGLSQGPWPDPTHAFLWDQGTMTDLGTLGGSHSEAWAINDLGQVVGMSTTASDLQHGFLWQNGTMTDLGTLGGPQSYAYDINNAGQVVGWTTGQSGMPHAFLWESGTMQDIGTLGGDGARAWGINDAGQVVGDSLSFGRWHAFVWQNGTMKDLGTLGGVDGSSLAFAINEAGQIVGSSDTTQGEHAFLWQDGAMTDLGAFRAYGLNDVGQIVGFKVVGNANHAVLWEAGTTTDLANSWNSNAVAVNNDGKIVGMGVLRDGHFHAVLWTTPFPVPPYMITRLPGMNVAMAINDAGRIVGYFTGGDACDSNAVVWDNGTITQIATIYDCSAASDVNAAGHVVGTGSYRWDGDRAYIWKDGVLTELGTLGGHSAYAYGLNDGDHVVGASYTAGGERHAFLWKDGTMTDLGTLGGSSSQGLAIDNFDRVVGWSTDASGMVRAFEWEAGTMTDLGTLPGTSEGIAYSINEAGQIVGSSRTSIYGIYHAVLWQNGTITDLGSLGGDFSEAYGINDAGQIVGVSRAVNAGTPVDNRPVIWDQGSLMELGVPAGEFGSTARDINAAGLIVGHTPRDIAIEQAILWTATDSGHDVAVISASATPKSAVVGTTIWVNATVENQGNQSETFDVVASTTGWSTRQTVQGLLPGDVANMTFAWDTKGVAPGTYAITVRADLVPGERDASDNAKAAGSVVIHLPPAVTVSAQPVQTDVGLAVVFECRASDGIAPYVFEWAFGDGAVAFGPTVDHAYASTGNQTATCDVTDGEGLQATASLEVQVHPSPAVAAAAQPDRARPGERITFAAVATGGTGNIAYRWDFGDGTSADGSTVTHGYAGPGTYTASVRVEDAVGGAASTSVVVTVSEGPAPVRAQATASAYETHVGMDVTFTCSATGGMSPYSFAWAFGDGLDGSGETVSHAYSTLGQKTATCTVRDGIGGTSTSSVTVQVYSLPVVWANVSRASASPGTPLDFTASATGGSGDFGYHWEFGDGAAAEGRVFTHTYASPGRYDVILTVQDGVGGTAPYRVSLTVTISFVTATAVLSTSEGQAGESISFSAGASGGAGMPYTFSWDFGDNTTGEGAIVSHAYAREGSYTPKLTVIDAAGASRETVLQPIAVRATPSNSAEVSSFPPLTSVEFVIGAAMGFAVAAAFAIAMLRRTRRKP